LGTTGGTQSLSLSLSKGCKVRSRIEHQGACENDDNRKAAEGDRLNGDMMERKEKDW